LDLASRFHPKQICNKVIGALLFVRVGGGLRLGGDPHVAPALAALSLVYAAARCSVAFVERSRSFHTSAALLGFLTVWAGRRSRIRGDGGRGLVDAGTRLFGGYPVRLEWAGPDAAGVGLGGGARPCRARTYSWAVCCRADRLRYAN
jgi:hypothetical protein